MFDTGMRVAYPDASAAEQYVLDKPSLDAEPVHPGFRLFCSEQRRIVRGLVAASNRENPT
jgi:hypothetical protein